MADTLETPAEAPSEPAEATNTTDTTPDTPDQVEGSETPVEADPALDPEQARKLIERANAEAAKYRTSLRSVEEKFKDAKTAEEFEAARNEWLTEKHEMTRSLVATQFNLPTELADVLKGDTEEDLRKHAETLVKFVAAVKTPPAPKGDLKGGLDPNEGDPYAGKTPAELAASIRR